MIVFDVSKKGMFFYFILHRNLFPSASFSGEVCFIVNVSLGWILFITPKSSQNYLVVPIYIFMMSPKNRFSRKIADLPSLPFYGIELLFYHLFSLPNRC